MSFLPNPRDAKASYGEPKEKDNIYLITELATKAESGVCRITLN